MTDLRTAAQQALEAMDKATRFMSDADYRKLNESIDTLKAALVEPVQEPVADRAAFERHAERLGYSVDPDTREGREGGYWSSHTQLMWLTWQAALAEPVQETGVKLKPVFYAPRMLDDEEVEDIIKRNAAITESILDIDRKEPQPGMVNLDAFRAFHFNDPPKGGFVGEIEMLKWLVRNRDGDYWKAKHGVQEPPCAPSECPNCASLQDQNTELDRKLAEMERKPMNEFDALRLVTESIGSLQSAGPVEGLIGIIRAVERAHGIT